MVYGVTCNGVGKIEMIMLKSLIPINPVTNGIKGGAIGSVFNFSQNSQGKRRADAGVSSRL